MGGTIGVESVVGVGSVFWFELRSIAEPQTAGNGKVPASLQPPQDPETSQGTVLYVEDNPANLQLVERIVARYPYLRLLTSVSGETGLESARINRPDVIFLDINLPGIGGFDVLQLLRRDPLTAHIPVVAISANAMPFDIERGLKAGFFRYVTKPINVGELVQTLKEALNVAKQPT
jgi:CheY-like chemotaxis protein